MVLKEKGATALDKMCHSVFASSAIERDRIDVACGSCGHKLYVSYCEDRLYLVECKHCKKKALVEAGNPTAAAYQTFAHAVYPVDEMGEGEAVFWDRLPIQDPPVYSGATTDCDFPDDIVCGMYLPCPGTDGKEIKNGDKE